MQAIEAAASPYAPPKSAVTDIERDQGNIRVEYDLKHWDYYLFMCTHQFFIVSLQVLNIAFAILGARMMGGMWSAEAVVVLAMVLYCILWVVQFVFNILMVFSRKNRSLYTRHAIEIQDAGFHEETRYNRSLHFWNGGVAKIVSRLGFVAVYTAAHQAHIVPARAFANKAHRSEFVASVRKRIAP